MDELGELDKLVELDELIKLNEFGALDDLKKQKMMGIGKIGDMNVKIMREGNRRLDFIQKEIGIKQIGDLT